MADNYRISEGSNRQKRPYQTEPTAGRNPGLLNVLVEQFDDAQGELAPQLGGPGQERKERLDAIEQIGHSIFRSGQSLIFRPRHSEPTCLTLQSPI